MSTPRILAVDDDPHQLASLERIFRRSGFEVVRSGSGRDGLRKAMEVLPDLILLDVTMPCMSGHEFLRRFRRLERRFAPDESSILAETPVIFVTGRGQLHQRVDGLDAGAIDYVTKPFDADELRARVRRALRETRRHSQVRTACQIDRLSHESAIDAAQLALAACGQALAELELDDGDTTDRACDALERIKQNMKVTASWIKCVVHELEGEATA